MGRSTDSLDAPLQPRSFAIVLSLPHFAGLLILSFNRGPRRTKCQRLAILAAIPVSLPRTVEGNAKNILCLSRKMPADRVRQFGVSTIWHDSSGISPREPLAMSRLGRLMFPPPHQQPPLAFDDGQRSGARVEKIEIMPLPLRHGDDRTRPAGRRRQRYRRAFDKVMNPGARHGRHLSLEIVHISPTPPG